MFVPRWSLRAEPINPADAGVITWLPIPTPGQVGIMELYVGGLPAGIHPPTPPLCRWPLPNGEQLLGYYWLNPEPPELELAVRNIFGAEALHQPTSVRGEWSDQVEARGVVNMRRDGAFHFALDIAPTVVQRLTGTDPPRP
jgi:hypothetical protein